VLIVLRCFDALGYATKVQLRWKNITSETLNSFRHRAESGVMPQILAEQITCSDGGKKFVIECFKLMHVFVLFCVLG